MLLQLDVLLLLGLGLALAVQLLLLSLRLARRRRAPTLASPLALTLAVGPTLSLRRGGMRVARAQEVHDLGRHLVGRLGGRRLGRRVDQLRRDLRI